MSTFGILGLALTPPLLGRISIGDVQEKNGKTLPVKDDQITVTMQYKVNRKWVKHPLDSVLRRDVEAKKTGKSIDDIPEDALELMNTKLRAIPVKLMFNDPSLNIRSEYTCFKDGRVFCHGNGKEAERSVVGENKKETVACNPVNCPVGEENRCKPYTRLNVQIDGQDDELGSFIYRTTGWNSLTTLQSKIHYLHGLSNGKLAGLPLDLVIKGKSSQLSMGSKFYYLDLVIRNGYSAAKAVKEAHDFQKEWVDAGINRDAFEESARQGIANGKFEDTPEDISNLLEEFFPEMEDDATQGDSLSDIRSQLDQENSEMGIKPTIPSAEEFELEHTS